MHGLFFLSKFFASFCDNKNLIVFPKRRYRKFIGFLFCSLEGCTFFLLLFAFVLTNKLEIVFRKFENVFRDADIGKKAKITDFIVDNFPPLT